MAHLGYYFIRLGHPLGTLLPTLHLVTVFFIALSNPTPLSPRPLRACGPLGAPPYTATLRMLQPLPNLAASCWICTASSRVGAMTSTCKGRAGGGGEGGSGYSQLTETAARGGGEWQRRGVGGRWHGRPALLVQHYTSAPEKRSRRMPHTHHACMQRNTMKAFTWT